MCITLDPLSAIKHSLNLPIAITDDSSSIWSNFMSKASMSEDHSRSIRDLSELSDEAIFFEFLSRCEKLKDQYESSDESKEIDPLPARVGEMSSQRHPLKERVVSLMQLADHFGLSSQQVNAQLTPGSALSEAFLYRKDSNDQKKKAIHAELVQGNIERAIAFYLIYIGREPSDHHARLRVGRLLISRAEILAAEAIHQTGLRWGDSPLLQALNAEILIANAQFKEGYERALGALEQSEDREILMTYALACSWVGREQEARERLRELINQDPNDLYANAKLLELDDPLTCPSETLLKASEAFESHPHPKLHHALITCLIRMRRYDKAQHEAQRLAAHQPKDLSAQLSLAATALYLSQLEDASERCEAILKRHPKSVSAIALNLMTLAARGSKRDQVEDLYRSLSETSKESVKVARWSAHLLELFGEREEALKLRSELASESSRHLDLLLDLVRALIEGGELDEAESIVDSLKNTSPHRLDVRLACAYLDFYRGNIEALDLIYESYPSHPELIELKLRALISMGSYVEARHLAENTLLVQTGDLTLIEYLINMLWHTEHDVETQLIRLYESLTPATRQTRILVLFAYLFLQLGRLDLAEQIWEDLQQREGMASFGEQRLSFACEIAHRLRDKQALNLWSSFAFERFPDSPSILFYHAVSQWYLGEYEEALSLSLQGLYAHNEQEQLDPPPVERLLVTAIWACELQDHAVAHSLIEPLEAHPDVEESELEALKVRVALLSVEDQEFQEGVRLAESWFERTDHEESIAFAIEWCLERVELSGGEFNMNFVSLRDDSPLQVVGGEERLIVARRWAQTALSQSPNRSELWRKLSICHQALGELEASVFALEKLISLKEETVNDYLGLSQLKERLGHPIGAREGLHRAIEFAQPSEIQSFKVELACLMLRQGDEEGAQHLFEKLIEEAQDAPMEQADVDQATQESQDSYSRQDLLYLWLSQGFAHLSSEAAFSLIERLRAWHPDAFIDGFLGAAYASFGRYGEALPLLQEIYQSEQSFGGDYAACLWALAQRDQAIFTLYECFERHPQEADFCVQLIHYLLEEGRGEEAYGLSQSLALISPEHEELEELEERVYASLSRH